MKLLVGLGNPGKEYKSSRHNVGFMALEIFKEKNFLDKKWSKEKRFSADVIPTQEMLILRPLTFMNNSGEAVSLASRYYKIVPEDILVIHDDLDLPLGEFRLQRGKGAAGHHGVESIIENLKTQDFWRMRVGINTPLRKEKENDADFVLEPFSKEEMSLLKNILKNIDFNKFLSI